MDKLKRSQIQKAVKIVREGLEASKETIIIPFSAETKQGREEIYEVIDGLLADSEAAEE